MEKMRKITVEIPGDLLDRARKASGGGVTQTVRAGLVVLAASETYRQLRGMRGRLAFSRGLADLKNDR